MSKTIIFFGNEQLATGVSSDRPVLRALQLAGYDIVPVEAKQFDPAEIAGHQAEAAVLVAYGKIMPPEILELFPRGIINLHPSLLPLYRGSSPIEAAILDGANQTGVSLMKLTPQMDTGPVYAQLAVLLNGDETKQGLADQLSELGAKLLTEHLPAILTGGLEAQPQDETRATYTKQISKSDGVIDWAKPAVQLEREVRAYAGWPRSTTRLGQTDVIITRAHVGDGRGQPGFISVDGKQLGVYSGDGLLIIDRLIPAGKPEMTTDAFLAGYKL